MIPSSKRDLPASVKARLLGLAKRRAEQLQSILVRYAIERLLYRLSRSPHADGFILKGAVLASTWGGGVYRPTKDLDLLGHGDSSPEALADIFRRIARTEVEADGIDFDPDSVVARSILEEAECPGVRINLVGFLGKARIPLQVDIGFGDPVTPAPVSLVFPCMLDFPSPVLQAYPPETVIAEKYEALVRLGMRTGANQGLLRSVVHRDQLLLRWHHPATGGRDHVPRPTHAPARTASHCSYRRIRGGRIQEGPVESARSSRGDCVALEPW